MFQQKLLTSFLHFIPDTATSPFTDPKDLHLISLMYLVIQFLGIVYTVCDFLEPLLGSLLGLDHMIYCILSHSMLLNTYFKLSDQGNSSFLDLFKSYSAYYIFIFCFLSLACPLYCYSECSIH